MKNESGVTIRTFVYPDDFAAVHTLWSNAGPGVHLGRSDTPQEIAKQLSIIADLFLVAENQDRITGSVICDFDDRCGQVYHLVVSPHAHLAGIGSALMAALEKHLLEKGCLGAYQLVTHDNQKAQHFYQSTGCEPLDLLILSKDLDQA
jgi:ribosomal protein S18 acetylase RimI-like enzyme